MENLNTRQELLLKALIESFISDGQPVGSSKLSKTSDIGISSATIKECFCRSRRLRLHILPA